MRVGCRLRWLGTGRTTWTDVRTVVRHAGPDSAIVRALRGHPWSDTECLLALMADSLAEANWQRQGKKGAARPKPVPRPWQQAEEKRIGKDPIPVSQFNTWWDSS